jgi:autotransporter-associated beta strand protein
VFDQRSQNRFYVADSFSLWGTQNQGATLQNLTANLPANIIRPTSVEFINNNGVDALLVGGLSSTANAQSQITVADSDANGNLSGWRLYGSGLPNALVSQMSYNPLVDVLAISAVGRGAWALYDVTSYFPQATALQFGLANNDSQPDASFLTDGTTLSGTSFSRPLNKYGTGTLTIAGNATYTGATTVIGGTLEVDGSIASSSGVAVNAGAALAGTGTVAATTIMTAGVLAPGNAADPTGTLAVAGNLAFQSGAFYLVQVNSAASSSTNVSGTASLAGTVNAMFAPGMFVAKQYLILQSAGLNGTTFSGLTNTNLPLNFIDSLSYSADDVFLNLTAALGAGTTLNVNQQNVANAINNFFNSGGTLPPAFGSLFGLTGTNLRGALDQVSGEAATGAQKVAFQLTDQFLNLMLDPFVDGRSGISGTDHPPLGFAPETRPSAPALAFASVFKAPPAAPRVYEPHWTVWGGAYGGGNHTSGDPVVIGSHDLSARTAGFATGFDYRLTPDSVLGFALAGGGTNWSLSQGLGGGRSDALQAGIYGATRWGSAYVAADFAFTNHWMSTDRFAFAADHLRADFNAQSYGGRLEGGYRFETPFVGVAPYAAIQAQSFHTPSYSETGTIPDGFALALGSRDASDTRSELGARFDRAWAVSPGAVLALRGRFAWAHDWVSDPTLMPLFQSLPGASFVVNGAAPPHDSALTSLGAELRFANGITLLAKFDGEFGSNSSTYAGTGTIRYTW